jgi:hypothetical protein
MRGMRRQRGRWLAALTLALLLATTGAATAFARPSGPVTNDEPGNGKWIYPSSLPYTDSMDVTQATSSAWDKANNCADEFDTGSEEGNTVWYRYRATSTVDLNLDTFGSSYDTTLTVFAAPGGYIDCNDDADDIVTNPQDLNNDLASYLQVHLQGGHTYAIRVGSYDDPAYCQTESSCDGVSDGALVFHAALAPIN